MRSLFVRFFSFVFLPSFLLRAPRGVVCSPPAAVVCLDAVCRFDFVVSRRQTMTYVHPSGTTFNVALSGSSLVVVGNSLRTADAYRDVIGTVVDPSHVITADGVPRDVIVVNGQFPGPTIEVLEGSQVVVRVTNSLLSEVTSIHWHGIYMRNNNFMDGVPYVTQCPILPGQSFVYRFRADPAGTHWYHSHHSNQRIDGAYGLLVVRPKSPAAPSPRPYHGVIVTDWYHRTGDAVALRCGTASAQYDGGRFTGETLRSPATRHRSPDGVELTSMSYVSSLVGGRGRHDPEALFPLAVYALDANRSAVFRLANAAADFSFEISVDRHRLDVASLDGHDIRPVTVDSVVVHPGETVDFEILADQSVSRYWLRARTLVSSGSDGTTGNGQEALAVLEYRGFVGDRKKDPQSTPRSCTESLPCTVFNCPFEYYPQKFNKSCRHVNVVSSRLDQSFLRSEYGLSSETPEEVFLNFAFVGGSSVNGRKFALPRGFDAVPSAWRRHIAPCNATLCGERPCRCTNIVSLPLNATIQMVLMNYQPVHDPANLPSHHAVHVHGHAFAVLALGFGMTRNASSVAPNPDIACDGPLCSSPRWTAGRRVPALNLADPPIKDTVLVPAQGYAIVRFRTDNPGRWMAHCHQELHFLKGMGVILEEGDPVDQPRPPSGLPSCGDFVGIDEVNDGEITKEPTTTPKQGVIVISLGIAAASAVGFLLLGIVVALTLLTAQRFVLTRPSRHAARNTHTLDNSGVSASLL